jgi:hypothetical protein
MRRMVRQLDSPIRAKKRPDHIASARQPFVTFAYGIHSSRAREAIAKLHEELHRDVAGPASARGSRRSPPLGAPATSWLLLFRP